MDTKIFKLFINFPFATKNIYISNKLQKLDSRRITYFKNVEPLGRNIQKILGQFLTTQKLRGNRSYITEIKKGEKLPFLLFNL